MQHTTRMKVVCWWDNFFYIYYGMQSNGWEIFLHGWNWTSWMTITYGWKIGNMKSMTFFWRRLDQTNETNSSFSSMLWISCICPTFVYEFHSCVIKFVHVESSIYFMNFIQILPMSFSYLCPTFMSEFHSYVINSSMLRILSILSQKNSKCCSHLCGEHHPFQVVSNFHVLMSFIHNMINSSMLKLVIQFFIQFFPISSMWLINLSFVQGKSSHPYFGNALYPQPQAKYPTHLFIVGTQLPHKWPQVTYLPQPPSWVKGGAGGEGRASDFLCCEYSSVCQK
jgi:hypothetical protein